MEKEMEKEKNMNLIETTLKMNFIINATKCKIYV